MKGLDNELYITLLIFSNIIAILQLVAAIKLPRIARLSFFLLFAWASWTNWKTTLQNPEAYLEYADLTWSRWYASFINGWFAKHISLVIGFVATSQALIAVSMLSKGWIYTIGCLGAIIFLVAILPFGVGAGFPATGIMAIACFILLKKRPAFFIWQNKHSMA
ncbi:MAG: hypothetical protein E6H09_14030 [Bacteroidetes bacterium]|jgi:hypothetical protein|nr:MAG: hypothetical protein E6H09_14030 [Bacteroidota bacterium]